MILNRFILIFSITVFNLLFTEAQSIYLSDVLPGIYKIDSVAGVLKSKKIALVANQASTINNIHLVDTLLSIEQNQPGKFSIIKIFSPEHGFSGAYEAGKVVKNSGFKNIPVVSLYAGKKKPGANDLKDIDVIVFDLQDVGTRFYTYISTLHYVMQACAEHNISLIILDRPNPNAHYIDGPVLEKKYSSFVGMHPVPVVYGMTIGEYAMMIIGEGWLGKNLNCNLSVVKIDNYSHHTPYTLPSKPSPNLPNMLSVYLYPSLCFFEGTVISEGRGTDFPFQVYGHPDYPVKDFSFIPRSIIGVSENPKFENELCYGVNLQQLDIDSLRLSEEININFIYDSYKSIGSKNDFFNTYFDVLAGTDAFRQSIEKGKTVEEIRSDWSIGIEKFKKIRAKYLLYPD